MPRKTPGTAAPPAADPHEAGQVQPDSTDRTITPAKAGFEGERRKRRESSAPRPA